VRNVIAISPYARQFLRKGTDQRVWDIDNPVADSFFDVDRCPASGRLLCAASITPLKNICGLIKGFASAARGNPGWELRIAGREPDAPYSARCRGLAQALKVGDRVVFLGPLSIQALQDELSQAAALALCSAQENAPLAIAEAMACGVPVLASNLGGIPWMVSDGKTGRLVNPSSTEDIGRGLRSLLGRDDLGIMGERAKAVAGERFRASSVAKKTLDVYREIVAAAREAPRLPDSDLVRT
jgi:glycosyltransferase involved in cell wall biosynthesis